MHFDGLVGIDEAAFEIACALIWLDAAQKEREIAIVGRQEFCDWTRQWSSYLNLSRKLARIGSLPKPDVEKVKTARQALGQAIDGGATFPKFWSLRADFVELLPKEERDKLLVEQQRDELEYLTRLRIDAKDRLKGDPLVEKAKAYEVLARARPALLVEDGVLKTATQTQRAELDVDPLWKRLFELDSSKESVRRASRATGLFRIQAESSGSSSFQSFPGMGFAIGEGLIATVAYTIMEPALSVTEANQVIEIPDEVEADFVFADRWPEESDAEIQRHRITRIYYLGESGSAQLALLEIEGHDTKQFPPLDIDLDATRNLGLRGFVCLVGFPERDARLPPEFMDALLGADGGGHKRVMPGRVVSLPPANAAPQFSSIVRNGIIVDASTSGGTGGAPLIDLVSGKLTGVNLAGIWQNLEDGKFAYSAPIVWLFPIEKMRAYIRQRGATMTLDGLLEQLDAVSERSEAEVLASLQATEVSTHDVRETPPEPTDPTLTAAGYEPNFLSTAIPLPQVKGADPGQISAELSYPNFSLVINTASDRRMAYFAAENVDGARLHPLTQRVPFRQDPRLQPLEQPDKALFSRNALDRGTLVRRSNVSWGAGRQQAEQAAEATFYYTNVTPQLSRLNQRSWLQLEEELLKYILERKLKASVFSGPVFGESDPEYRGIRIPRAFWKIMVADVESKTLAVGYILEQEIAVTDDEISGWAAAFDAINSQVEISEIELKTGIDFGPLRDLPTLDFSQGTAPLRSALTK